MIRQVKNLVSPLFPKQSSNLRSTNIQYDPALSLTKEVITRAFEVDTNLSKSNDSGRNSNMSQKLDQLVAQRPTRSKRQRDFEALEKVY